MKAKRNRSRSKSPTNKVTSASVVVGFTETEEAFFRAGTMELESTESFTNMAEADAEAGERRPSLLRRLFTRSEN